MRLDHDRLLDVKVGHDRAGPVGGAQGRGDRLAERRQAGDGAGELLGIFGANLGQPVIGDAGEFGRGFRVGKRIECGQAQREDLRIAGEHVHLAATGLQIVNVLDAADALANIGHRPWRGQHLVEKRRREKVIERVDIMAVMRGTLGARLDRAGPGRQIGASSLAPGRAARVWFARPGPATGSQTLRPFLMGMRDAEQR